MPAGVTYIPYEPKWIATGGIESPRIQQAMPAQTAAFRTGDLVQNITTGTVTAPTGGTAAAFTNATGLLTPGPSLGSAPVPFNITGTNSVVQGTVTVTGVTSASAPAQTLYGVVTYNITSTTESQPSVPFIINTVAGVLPSITVAAAGAPAGATTFRPYLGFFPNSWYAQSGVVTLGTLQATTYPLTNSIGINKSVANPTTIFGLADCDSDAYFGGILGATAGGSQNTGKRSLFGATQSYAPGWPNDPFQIPIVKMQTGMLEINLVQAWSTALIGTSVGLNIDPSPAATGYFVADNTQSNLIAVIQDIAAYPGYSGNTQDFYARVRIQFNAAALV